MTESVMRALHSPAAGERPELSGLLVPEPGEGQFLIRVKAAGRQSRAPIKLIIRGQPPGGLSQSR